MRTWCEQIVRDRLDNRLALWLAALIALCSIDNEAVCQCLRYTVQVSELGCSGSGTSAPYGINTNGDLAGRVACGFGMDHAFVAWSPNGPVAPLNLTPSDFWSRANDINDGGQITGWMEVVGVGIRGFMFHNGQTIDLGSLAPSEPTITEAIAINETASIVGYTSSPGGSANHAFLWTNGRMIDLDLPIGPSNQANDINDNNQVVGWMGVATGSSFPADAFLWEDGVSSTLVRPKVSTSAAANAINHKAEICGAFWFPNPTGGASISHPILWLSPTEYVDLGLLPGYLRGWALDINDALELVGYCQTPPPGGSRAFIWRNGSMVALNSVLAPGFEGNDIRQAWAINNNGQIAADIYTGIPPSRAALLTPLPPNPGDTNCDWDANITDLLNVIGAWGPYVPPPPGPLGPHPGGPGTPDLNDDGLVNILDVLTVIQFWGS